MQKSRNFNQLFWGLVIILVGFLFLVENLGFVENFSFWKYLPVIVILLGIYQLVINQFRAWTGPAILTLVGIFLLLATLNIISWSVFGNLIWPTVLILVGLNLIFNRPTFQKNLDSEFETSTEKQFTIFTAFSGHKRKITAADFSNGETTVMFGGNEIDLTGAQVNEAPARMQTTVMFGGSEIFVPADWDVRNHVVAFFGGVDDKRRSVPQQKETPDLIITGTVMFGGLTIRD